MPQTVLFVRKFQFFLDPPLLGRHLCKPPLRALSASSRRPLACHAHRPRPATRAQCQGLLPCLRSIEARRIANTEFPVASGESDDETTFAFILNYLLSLFALIKA